MHHPKRSPKPPTSRLRFRNPPCQEQQENAQKHHARPRSAAARPRRLPPWLPVGDRWNDLPEAIRQAVPRILVPAYRQFVLDAPDELQRSIGLTLVHLLWLEVCDQMHLVEVVADPTFAGRHPEQSRGDDRPPPEPRRRQEPNRRTPRQAAARHRSPRPFRHPVPALPPAVDDSCPLASVRRQPTPSPHLCASQRFRWTPPVCKSEINLPVDQQLACGFALS